MSTYRYDSTYLIYDVCCFEYYDEVREMSHDTARFTRKGYRKFLLNHGVFRVFRRSLVILGARHLQNVLLGPMCCK